MNKKSKLSLINKYPTLYKRANSNNSVFSEFNCGEGWFRLIETLSKLIVSRSKNTFALHVREKFGHLSTKFQGYSNSDYFYIFGLTNMAYSLSELICDQCGNRGYLFNCPGTINPRCETHDGFPLDFSRPEISPHLPFNLNNIGVAWSEMISNFYQQILIHVRENKMPEVIINGIGKRGGQLYIDFSGGDETVDGMIDLLVAYTSITDEMTGDLIK